MSDELRPILECLIFLSQEPLTLERISAVLEGVPEEDIRRTLESLTSWAAPDRGLHLLHTGGGWLFATRPEFDAWARKFLQIERKTKLTSASLETLSIVAYHQPITQSEISAIRGVDSTGSLKTLLEKKLIKIIGHKKAPGHPLIYRTSERFLQYFGLNSLDDLPKEEEIAKLLEEDKTGEA
jgi:segregation and condensation protein B